MPFLLGALIGYVARMHIARDAELDASWDEGYFEGRDHAEEDRELKAETLPKWGPPFNPDVH